MYMRSMLNDEPAFNFNSAFQFGSAFKYNRIAGAEGEAFESSDPPPDRVFAWHQKLLRSLILVSTYSAIAVTFPLSFWFCVQKVKSLERCVIFRLGQRLPLQGPGYVLTLPCFDVVDIIDLSPQTFQVTDNEQSILTSDGSIVQLKNFAVTVSVADAVKSFTQIRDSKMNIQKFVRLAFQNVLSGSHVEDLERKIDWIVKSFVLSCNQDILKWGWDITGNTMPKVVVISRAEPTNLLVETLKSYFSGQGSAQGGGAQDSGNVASEDEVHIRMDGDVVPDPFVEALQSVAGKFTALRMMGIGSVTLSLAIGGEGTRFYEFTTLTGKIQPLTREVAKIDVQVRAASAEQFLLAIQNNDMSLIEVEHQLLNVNNSEFASRHEVRSICNQQLPSLIRSHKLSIHAHRITELV